MKQKIYCYLLFLLSCYVPILNGSENDDVGKFFFKLHYKRNTKIQNLAIHLGSGMDYVIQKLQSDAAEGNILANKLYWTKFDTEITLFSKKKKLKETLRELLGQNPQLLALRALIVDKKYEEDGKAVYSIFRTLLVKTINNGNFIITRETVAGMDPWKNYGSPIISCQPVQRDEEDYILWKNVSGEYQMWINVGLNEYYHIITSPEMNHYEFKKSVSSSEILTEKIAYVTMMWPEECELPSNNPHIPNQTILPPNLLHIMTFKQMYEIISDKSKRYPTMGEVLRKKELDLANEKLKKVNHLRKKNLVLQNEKMKKDDKNQMSDYYQVKAIEYYWKNMERKIKEIFADEN